MTLLAHRLTHGGHRAGWMACASSILALLAATPALAQANQWTGAVNTDFNTPGNWSAGPPTGNVVIDFRPNRPVVNGTATVGAATVNSDLTVSGVGRLNATSLSQTTGILDNSGTLNVTQPLQNGATVINRASGRITGGVNSLANSTLTNAGGTITGGVTVQERGLLQNDAGLVSGGLDNAGTVNSSGSIQGNITNRGKGAFVVQSGAATGDGAFLNQDRATLSVTSRLTGLASLTNTSTAPVGVTLGAGAMLSAGSMTNAAGATMQIGGDLSSGTRLQNAGTLNVQQTGVVNGGTVNTGTLLNSGRINGGLTSSGTVTNTATGIVNGGLTSSGSFTNAGTVNDKTEITDGLFDNTGRLRDTVTVIGGRLVSVAPGSRIEKGLVNSATAEVAGVMTGAIDNRAGGRLIVQGDTQGDGVMTNAQGATLALAGGNLSGMNTIDNAGTISASGTRTLGTAGLNNLTKGSVSLQNGTSGDTLTINGPYQGTAGSRLGIDVGGTKASGAAADKIIVNGPASGTSTLTVSKTDGGGLLAQPVEVVRVGAGSSLSLNTGKVASVPYINYFLNESSPGSGSFQLTSEFNAAPLASLASGLSGALSSMSATLYQPLNPLISRPVSCGANEFVVSPFLRMAAGSERLSGTASSDAPDGSTTATTRGTATNGGFHGGLDFGVCNVGGSRWSLHLGLSGGTISTATTTRTDLPGRQGSTSTATSTVKLDVPFLAAHALATHGGFNLELMARYEQIGATLATSGDGITYVAEGTKLTSRGLSFSGLASYRFALPYAAFIEPHVGLTKGSATFKQAALATGGSDSIAFSSASTGHFRAGVNVGTSLKLGSGMIVSPFAHFSLWTSLGSTLNGTATLASIGETVTVKGDAGGSFGQIGGGVMMRTTGGGFSGFVRGDMRVGGKVQGQALSAGVRLTF